MAEPIIDIQNFRKSYGDYVAVDGISFSIQEGEIFGLLGPNGAGKTSTLESLEGIRQADSGIIKILGLDPAREPRKLQSVIGVQLQSSGLPESITAVEAMNLFCAYHEVEPRIDLLDRLGLADKHKAQFFELSTGQQRRLSLALAVAHDPKILFLDEPTAGLDVGTRVELHQIMKELTEKGTTIILATHDMAEAEEMADRVAILLDKKIVTIGSPMDITATGSGLTKISVRTKNATLKNSKKKFTAIKQNNQKEDYVIYFSTDIGRSVAEIIKEIESKKDILIDLRVERPSLEDRFLEITSNGDDK